MNKKTIYLPYFLWGLFFAAFFIASLATGKTWIPEDYECCSFFIEVYLREEPFLFVIGNLAYALAALFLLYGALLFIPANRDYRILQDGFDRREVGLEDKSPGLSISRVLMVSLVSVLILVFVGWLFWG